jgi:polyphenol oxidase
VPNRPGENKIEIVRASHLSEIPWLVHGFSTRRGGFSRAYGGEALNLGFSKHDSKAAVERNRAALLQALGDGCRGRAKSDHRPKEKTRRSCSFVTLRQIHSDAIHFLNSTPQQQWFGDGLVTDTPGLFLAVQTADCLPIMLVDPERRAVGVFHAGWRGTAKRIVEKGVGKMRFCFGSRPRHLRAAIGPGIRGCCYNVGEEVREIFESQFPYAAKWFREVQESDPVREKYPLLFLTARAPGHSELPKKIFLDLVEANRQQLIAAGVSASNIEASPLCTNCRTDLLFSHRAEKGKTGRMMAVAGIQI